MVRLLSPLQGGQEVDTYNVAQQFRQPLYSIDTAQHDFYPGVTENDSELKIWSTHHQRFPIRQFHIRLRSNLRLGC